MTFNYKSVMLLGAVEVGMLMLDTRLLVLDSSKA